ncbi:MAG: hypothetical protein KF832_01630 [Caldilineaceae bacterium]|nr:hypothetical protein [Caldilineaceae bacterium]
MIIRRFAWFMLALLSLLLWDGKHTLYAAPTRQIITVQGPVLQGELPYQYNAHYLGLEPTLRDALVTLTLSYDPQNNPNLQGFVNFFVLDEDGLRNFLAGSDPEPLAIAGGSPLQFDPVGNKMSAAFRTSGRGQYTVVVYNNSLLPITYSLRAEGGVLVDNANQTLATASQSPEPTAEPTPTPAEPINPLGSAAGQKLTGVLSNQIGRHYLSAVPGVRDGTVFFNFHYDPLDQPTLHGNVNFWVLDEAGLNAIIRGDKPSDVNLATGFPAPFSPFPNDLQANFNASGKDPYTVVVYNQTPITASYELFIDGGTLYDRYGQTLEAKEVVTATTPATTPASTPTASAVSPSANSPAFTLVSTTGEVPTALTSTEPLPLGVMQVAGNFQGAYQYHYLALRPILRDGMVTLSLAFEPSDSKALLENLNFWVLTEEGLRQVISGGPPSAYDIATGAYQYFGPYKGKLYASFNASGHGKYTVIVFSNVDMPARYLLSAEGGLLATEDVNVTLP